MVSYGSNVPLHAEALRLAAPVAQLLGWGPVHALSKERLLYCCDLAAHYRSMDELDSALSQLPLPMEGSSAQAVKDQSRSQKDYEELTLQRIQEDCCFHLPLDHEFGESLKPRELEHWKRAPTVSDGPGWTWGPKKPTHRGGSA